jgi:hypothetical protein
VDQTKLPEPQRADFTTHSVWTINVDGKQVLHREDGPAMAYKTHGAFGWYYNGILHRIDGPAIRWENGDEDWWFNGKMHREDGPALIHAGGGELRWFKHGIKHRIGGPAVVVRHLDTVEYWIDGVEYEFDDYQYLMFSVYKVRVDKYDYEKDKDQNASSFV